MTHTTHLKLCGGKKKKKERRKRRINISIYELETVVYTHAINICRRIPAAKPPLLKHNAFNFKTRASTSLDQTSFPSRNLMKMNESHATCFTFPTRDSVPYFLPIFILLSLWWLLLLLFVQSIKKKGEIKRKKKNGYRRISWLGRWRWTIEKKRRLAPPVRIAGGWRRSAGSPWPRYNMSVAMMIQRRCFSIRKTATDDFLHTHRGREEKNNTN